MFESSDRVVVGVSGGPDSVFLLYILNQLKHELGINILAAHANHGLRKNSAVDQRFVKKLTEAWQLPFITDTLKIKRNKSQSSIEELARNARFKFLISAAKNHRHNVIALGHTQNDLAETVLMRILRGTGLLGLRGILAKRKINGCWFVRPLLDIRRQDIEAFLKKNKIKFRTDPSNLKTDFSRNKIRLELLPLLAKDYNPDIRQTLANLANTITIDYDYLRLAGKGLAEKLFRVSGHNKTISIKLSALLKLHPSMQRTLIRLAFEKLKGDTRRLTFAHIKEIESLILQRPSGSLVNLPHGVTIVKKASFLTLALRKS